MNFCRLKSNLIKSIKGIKNIDCINFQEEYPLSQSSCWLSCICLKKIRCRTTSKTVAGKRNTTRRVFLPVTEMPPTKHIKQQTMKMPI